MLPFSSANSPPTSSLNAPSSMQTPRPNSHLSIFSRHQGATRLHVTTAQTIPIIVMSTCALFSFQPIL
ncbi:hypothetical protein BGW80DRAFT_1315376 [Lactifluus volemus]|nr:hypothetical protein BGW80DRAFT_1315376 [Lactifluus volemus]